ncbi:MAG TPA: ATP-binding protein [Nitrospiraceae bacterium]|nr:ATP-binding protein [Nitrospiraceae bacterium]
MIVLREWWSRLRVQQKVWTILLGVFVPLVAALAVQVSLINHLLIVQQQHRQTDSTLDEILVLRRLAVDIEDAFRGYLLTGQEVFLKPLKEAQPKLQSTITHVLVLADGIPELAPDVRRATEQLNELLDSKRALIQQFQAGHADEVLNYVRSGKGLALSDALRDKFRGIEDRLEQRLELFEADQGGLAQRAFWGLLLAVVGGLALGLVGARLLTRSITGPLAVLQASATTLGEHAAKLDRHPESIAVRSSDEIGKLARSFEEMARRIRGHIRELEAINAIGHEISTIGPDGLEGVLRRITDHAAELLQVDVCLVMLRNEQMKCWVIEAASGEWNDELQKTVMLWEEFPVSVRAFETRKPTVEEDLRQNFRPQVVRPHLICENMLAVPLLSQGAPFGVLAFLQNRKVSRESWNVSLAEGFADKAAIVIANARLYEAAHQKEKGFEFRLRHLEHLAETLAHDLKAPGERMEGLASMLRQKYGDQLDARATRWLRLIEENGKDLTERVHDILEVARVGVQREAVEAVDPALVLHDVLKARAGELERRQVKISVETAFPKVACHRAYLRQVFDNLISNAIKFSGDRPDPAIRIATEQTGSRVRFSVRDNGIGIPTQERERVFEPFVRLNQGSAKGSGIGLAIVKRIIELYGGRVWIESPEEPGCAVIFTLPALGDLSDMGRSNKREPVSARAAELPDEANESVSLPKGEERYDQSNR